MKQLEQNKPDSTIDRMIFLDGNTRSFRCDCGCNVFREIELGKYKCNSCEIIWKGEK